jgi:hypothetical protein
MEMSSLSVRQETTSYVEQIILSLPMLTGTGRKQIINICLTTYSDLIIYGQKGFILRIWEKTLFALLNNHDWIIKFSDKWKKPQSNNSKGSIQH